MALELKSPEHLCFVVGLGWFSTQWYHSKLKTKIPQKLLNQHKWGHNFN